MNNRIKTLRKTLKLSQEAFGKRIRIAGASVSRLESGENKPSEQTISLICSSFNVSESWLRTGDGDMFLQAGSGDVDRLVAKYGFSDVLRKLLVTYERMNSEQQKVMDEFTRQFFASLAPAAPDPIEERVAAYRAELQAEEQAQTSSASQTGKERIG